jgi:hypothetical protein
VIKLARQTANGLFVADVGSAESAGSEAAEVPAGLNQHHALTHLRRLDRGGHATRSATVNHHVVDRRVADGSHKQKRQ